MNHHRWTILAIAGICVLIDLIRWQHGLPWLLAPSLAEELEYQVLFEALQPAEQALARRVNPTLMSPEEWRHKRSEPDSFAARVAARPLLPVLGDRGEIGDLG